MDFVVGCKAAAWLLVLSCVWSVLVLSVLVQGMAGPAASVGLGAHGEAVLPSFNMYAIKLIDLFSDRGVGSVGNFDSTSRA